MKGETSEHKVINISSDKCGNWYLIITSTSLWEAGNAICWAVDSVAKCQKFVFELCANCMCASGLAVPQLATASLCHVQCQSAFIKDPGASKVLASVLSCHCRWAQQVSKCWYLFTMYSHGVTAHKTVIYTVTLLGTSHSLVCYMPCKLIPICMYLGSFLYTFATKLVLWVGDTASYCLGGARFGSEPRVLVLAEIFHGFT